jgi:hypothetical protein
MTQAMCDASHTFSVGNPIQNTDQFWRDGLSNTLGRKRLTLEYFRRLKERGPRGRVIEFALIALLIAFAALQAFFVFGPRAI